MAEAYYEPTPATDGATMNPVPGAVFQVFEIADTTFSTPLSLRVGSGNPTTTVTASETLATLPGVYVTSPNYEHIWKSGTFEWRRDSIDGAKKAIEDAKLAASNSASSASSAASEAATSAQAAQNAAALVDAPADQIMADVAANSGSAFAGQLNATIAERVGGSGAAQAFLSLIENGTRNADMLVVGDSTGNETSEWVYLFITDLAAQYPSHTFQYRLWNDGTQTYDAATTIATGAGTRTVTLWNASIAGATTQSWQGTRITPAILATPADVVLISLGHNEQPDVGSWRGRYLSLTETISTRKPTTPLILIGQNPATANTLQAQRIEVYRDIAARRGYGFIDAHHAFVEAGGNLTVDGIHPTAAGSRLWADTVLGSFTKAKGEPRTQPSSTLVEKTPDNLAPNGLLTEWTGSVPTGWTFNLCTPTKDTAGMETGTAAVAVTCDSAGGNVTISLDPAKVKGKTVTLAVRVKISAGAANTTGRLALIDSATSNIQINESYPTDGYRWMMHTATFSANPATARIQIYAGTVGSQMTIDRAILVEGVLPRDASPTATASGNVTVPQGTWVAPAGLAPTATVTVGRLYLKRVGPTVYCLISNMVLPAASPQMKVATIPTGYRSVAGLPGEVASSIAQVLATGDADPKNTQFMAASGGDLWWNGARNANTGALLASPARIDGVLTWTTEDPAPA